MVNPTNPLAKRQRTYTEAFRLQVLADYAAGLSGYQLKVKYGVPQPTVFYWAKNAGISRPLSVTQKRGYHCREDAFADAIHDQEAAYWIGLLMADGCICTTASRSSPTIHLGLKASDRAHVEAFRFFLGSNHKIIETHTPRSMRGKQLCSQPLSCLRLNSVRLATDLAQYGVVPRKSKTACVTGGLEFSPHFWRGMVDGDGWISFIGKHHSLPSVGLTGSRKVVEQFVAFVASVCNGRLATIHPNATVWKATVAGAYAARIAEVLYGGATVALPRKAEKAALAMRWRRQPLGSYGAKRGRHDPYG